MTTNFFSWRTKLLNAPEMRTMNKFIRTFMISSLALNLSGCDLLWGLAKEIVIAPTARYSWSNFNFKGELPADFGITAIAFYGPVNHNKSSCRTPTLEPGQTVAREQIDNYEAKISKEPQSFSFYIPLTYSIGFCSMELERVILEIDGRFGEKDWQSSYGRGGLYIVRELRPGARDFDKNGHLNITSECAWTFQESKMHLQLDKMLSCKGAGARLRRKSLSGKTVSLNVSVSKEEKPSQDETWIKFDNGWKPCAVKNGWEWCREPIEFKTFKMNGHICTIYPTCTEQ